MYRSWNKKLLLLLVFTTILIGVTDAQDFEKEFQEFKKEQSQSFKDYHQKIDEEFSEFLANSWDEFVNIEKEEPSPKPKPKVLPPEPPKEEEEDLLEEDLGSLDDLITESPARHKQFQMPTKESAKDFDVSYALVRASFFGQSMKVDFDEQIFELSLESIDEKGIAKAWEDLGKTDYSTSIFGLFKWKSTLQINDYGLYAGLNQLLESQGLDETRIKVISWFLLLKMGYNIKIGRDAQGLFHLLPTLQPVYNTRFVEIDGINYYSFEERNDDKFKTYRNTHALAQRHFDLSQMKPLNFQNGRTASRKVDFQFREKTHTFDFTYDMNAIEYYQSLPQIAYDSYLFAEGSRTFKKSISDQLGNVLKDLNDHDRVSFLLELVQQGFAYKTDDDHFGYEKFYWPEELFHYEYSDCEDRSALLIYMVKAFTDFEVCALDYPQHIAVAVALDKQFQGRFYSSGGKRYYVTDPTYIGAPIGKSLVSDKPKVLLDPTSERIGINRQAVERIQSSGNKILYQSTVGNNTYLYVRLANGDFAFLKVSKGQLAYASKVKVPVTEENMTTHLLTFDDEGSLIAYDAFDEVGYNSYGIYANQKGSFITLPGDQISVQ